MAASVYQPVAALAHPRYLLDAQGRKVAGVLRKDTAAGAQRIELNLTGLGLPPGLYEYQLEASTRTGVFRQSRLMSAELD